jgi:crossover junction endodeoxyribonuclease RuvC
LAAAQAGLRIAEYNPTEIKAAVAGFGRAEKMQVQKAVFALLSNGSSPEALGLPVSKDALTPGAAAICHMQSSALSGQLQDLAALREEHKFIALASRSLRNVLPKKTIEQLLTTAQQRSKAK